MRQSLSPPLILLLSDSPNLEAPIRLSQAARKLTGGEPKRFSEGMLRKDADTHEAKAAYRCLETLLGCECTNEARGPSELARTWQYSQKGTGP